jgi:hypothetical protein
LCQFSLSFGLPALAEDYSECRLRCETENTDCVNETPAPEPEVQAAKLDTCGRKLQICYAECENLRPVEPPTGVENNPNIIIK